MAGRQRDANRTTVTDPACNLRRNRTTYLHDGCFVVHVSPFETILRGFLHHVLTNGPETWQRGRPQHRQRIPGSAARATVCARRMKRKQNLGNAFDMPSKRRLRGPECVKRR